MKTLRYIFTTGVLMSALCAGFVACNDNTDGLRSGLGEEIPGVETQQAKGTIIGGYSNGFGSLLLQVDDEYPIGKQLEYFDDSSCTSLPEDGVYSNMIQVQCKLPFKGSNRITFSVREFRADEDRDLFTVGSGLGNAMCANPDVPIYVITEFEILNN